jgi:hypothetical protein
MSRRSTKPKKKSKKTPKPRNVRELSASMKKSLNLNKRLADLQAHQERQKEVKLNEAEFLANLMFSVNALVNAMTTRRIPVLDLDENNRVQLNDDGTIRYVYQPLISHSELNQARAKAIEDYTAEVKKDLEMSEARARVLEYDGEKKSLEEWAQFLEISCEQLQEYLEMGADLEDIIAIRAEESLTESEQAFIKEKVSEVLETSKAPVDMVVDCGVCEQEISVERISDRDEDGNRLCPDCLLPFEDQVQKALEVAHAVAG